MSIIIKTFDIQLYTEAVLFIPREAELVEMYKAQATYQYPRSYLKITVSYNTKHECIDRKFKIINLSDREIILEDDWVMVSESFTLVSKGLTSGIEQTYALYEV